MIRFALANGSGGLGMVDNPGTWPSPSYRTGPPAHLHALGVVASEYNNFEDRLFDLYQHHLKKRKISKPMQAIASQLYFKTSEDKRPELIEHVFSQFEKDVKVMRTLKALNIYYLWCHTARNTLIHSMFDPPFFGGSLDVLYITKRGRKNPKYGFAKFELSELRDIADAIHAGFRYCVDLNWYLRYRDTPKAKWSLSMRVSGSQELPDIPKPPKLMALSDIPHTPPLPRRLRRSSRP
jgi:hypothetical protein